MQRRARRVRPPDVVEDDPAARLQEAIDKKKREAVGLPAMRAVDEAQVDVGLSRRIRGALLEKSHQRPVIGGSNEGRYPRAQPESFDQSLALRVTFDRRRSVDRLEVAAPFLFQRSGEIRR